MSHDKPSAANRQESRIYLTGNGVCWITASEKKLIKEWMNRGR